MIFRFLHNFGKIPQIQLKYTFNHCSKLSLNLNAQAENQTFIVIDTPYRKVLLKTDCLHDQRKVQQFGGPVVIKSKLEVNLGKNIFQLSQP